MTIGITGLSGTESMPVGADRIRINTDGFPKRGLKILGGAGGMFPRENFFDFDFLKSSLSGFLSHSDRILASSIPLR